MRKLLLATALLALSGCAHSVIAPCISREQLEELRRQEPPRVKSKLTGRADEDVRPIAGSNLLLRTWGHNLLSTLEVCAK